MSRRDKLPRPNLRWLVILLVALASVLAYAAVSATINAEPSTEEFHGWVMVLQDGGKLQSDDQVELLVARSFENTTAGNGRLLYSVGVCGPEPLKVLLVIGGDARLAKPQLYSFVGAPPTSEIRSHIRDFAGLKLTPYGGGSDVDLGTVQIVNFDMQEVKPCTSLFVQGQPTGRFVGQEVKGITGITAAPVSHRSNFGWWTGPRMSEAWPTVGGIPRVEQGAIGPFGPLGAHGPLFEPKQQHIHVRLGQPFTRISVDEARPAFLTGTILGWEDTKQFSPIARLTDVDSLSAWQQAQVIAAISVGIGGSLFASMFFEWGRRANTPTSIQNVEVRHRSRQSGISFAPTTVWDFAISVVVAAVMVLLVRYRRRS